MAGLRGSALARQRVRAVGACRGASAVPPRRAAPLQNFTLCASCKLHAMCSSMQGAAMLDSVEEPRNARSRRTRAALLEGHGAESLTMAAVAERAGVSRRAVYLHFASRAELLAELFGHVSEQEGLAASLQPVWDAPDATTALDQWARHLARFHPRILAVARAIQRVRRVDPDAAAHWELVMADQQACCHRLAAWLAREHRLAPPW